MDSQPGLERTIKSPYGQKEEWIKLIMFSKIFYIVFCNLQNNLLC